MVIRSRICAGRVTYGLDGYINRHPDEGHAFFRVEPFLILGQVLALPKAW